jgi:glycosyltransferase involved in cell wall biosynthesis
MPFFSVIIPLYNKEQFIENTLRSVLAQTFTDFEVIIVNDGSTDQSGQKVSAFTDERIRYVSKSNEGVSATRNHGISLAATDFITFLDADDYWYPEFLKTMKNNISDFPDQKVFSAAVEIETPKTILPAVYSIEGTNENQVVDYFESSEIVTSICTSCAVFHKSVFDKSGVFDMAMNNSEDIDLWMRIGLDFPVVFSRKILARYVYDPQSLSRNQNVNIDFSKFSNQEKHPGLKRFLDLNRFSLAIKSKVNGDDKNYRSFRNDIDRKNLSLKKKILLSLPGFLLKKLIRFREKMADMGLADTVFK